MDFSPDFNHSISCVCVSVVLTIKSFGIYIVGMMTWDTEVLPNVPTFLLLQTMFL